MLGRWLTGSVHKGLGRFNLMAACTNTGCSGRGHSGTREIQTRIADARDRQPCHSHSDQIWVIGRHDISSKGWNIESSHVKPKLSAQPLSPWACRPITAGTTTPVHVVSGPRPQPVHKFNLTACPSCESRCLLGARARAACHGLPAASPLGLPQGVRGLSVGCVG